jgi:hypothetical protein
MMPATKSRAARRSRFPAARVRKRRRPRPPARAPRTRGINGSADAGARYRLSCNAPRCQLRAHSIHVIATREATKQSIPPQGAKWIASRSLSSGGAFAPTGWLAMTEDRIASFLTLTASRAAKESDTRVRKRTEAPAPVGHISIKAGQIGLLFKFQFRLKG